MLYPVTRLGEDAQLTIVDSSAYAGLDEGINWWQLVARCQNVGDVLMGYYAIPDHMDEPLNTVVDPLGMEVGTLLHVHLAHAFPDCWETCHNTCSAALCAGSCLALLIEPLTPR